MRKVAVQLIPAILVAALVSVVPSYSQIIIGGGLCARDIVPSASLLVPYIVVDTNADGSPNPSGYTTLTVVTNASSAKQLIHVTVWNAMSEPVVDFDEVMSGYDVWSINWRDLVTGSFNLFDTGTPALGFWNPPAGTTATIGTAGSAFGPTSNPLGPSFGPTTGGLQNPQDTDYPTPTNTGCGFPWGNLSAYAGIIQAGLQSPLYAWTGTYQDTNCDTVAEIGFQGWLTTLTASPLFFYATIDTVYACNGFFPNQVEYWSYDNGVTVPGYNTDNNVLTGYDFYLNFTANFSESLPAVGLEAIPGTITPGFYTPNKQIADPNEATITWGDTREPLGTAYAFNYLNAGGVTTDVAVWKSAQEFDITTRYEHVLACAPYIYYAWDENEQAKARTITTCPSGLCFGNPEPNVFPFQTQRVPVNTVNFTGLMTGNGWMLIVFDPAIPYPSPYDPATALDGYLQAYVFAKYTFGAYSTAVEATTMSNVWCFPTQVLPNLNMVNFLLVD